MAEKFKYTDIQVLYELPKQINKTLMERRDVMARKAVKVLKDWIHIKAYDKGTLRDSVDYHLTKVGNDKLGFELLINGDAAKYDLVQDQGLMQGTWPDIDRIMLWLRDNHGSFGQKAIWNKRKTTRKKKQNALRRKAFMVAKTIYEKGVEPKNFYEPAMDEINEMVNREIGKWAHSFQMK